jgi:hypothetical protein
VSLIQRARNMLLAPGSEWRLIREEPSSVAVLFAKYAVILAAIPALAGFIGYSLVGVSLPFFGTFRYPLGRGLAWALLTYVLSLAGAFLLVLVVDGLAPFFATERNLASAAKIVVFSYTASWIGGLFAVLPGLSPLVAMADAYSLVLLWLGIKALKNVSSVKAAGYFLVTLIVAVAVYFIVALVASSVALGGGAAAGVFNSSNP